MQTNNQFNTGKIYLLKENLFVLHANGKKTVKKKGHTRNTNFNAFSSHYIDKRGKYSINEDNKYLNELSVKKLCTYNFNFSSFVKLTSLAQSAKETIFTLVELKDSPINDVPKFISYLCKLCNFNPLEQRKDKDGNLYQPTFEPTLVFCFAKKKQYSILLRNPSFNQVKLPTIKFYNGSPTQKSIKQVSFWLESANYHFTYKLKIK